MTSDHPVAARYLERLTQALETMPAADRAEVVQEISQHIADAVAAGRPLDDVLTALGAADDLARAYQVELLLHPKAPPAQRPRAAGRWLALIGFVAIGSLPTFIIVVVLGSIGVSFVVSGLAVFVAGLLQGMGALPYWIESDIYVAPWVTMTTGPLLLVLGLLALWGLVGYVKLIARLARQVLPRAETMSGVVLRKT